MTRSVFVGWICRVWTETISKGFIYDIARFNTEQEADQHGRAMMRLPFGYDELSREYEVYKDFDLQEVKA